MSDQLELTDGSAEDTVDSTESSGRLCPECGTPLRRFDPEWWWCDTCKNGTTDWAVSGYPEYRKEKDMAAKKKPASTTGRRAVKKAGTRRSARAAAPAAEKKGTTTANNGDKPIKVGKAAGMRIAEVKKENGAAAAKDLTAKATAIASKAGLRMVKIEQVLEAQGVKVTPELIKQYRKGGSSSNGSGLYNQTPSGVPVAQVYVSGAGHTGSGSPTGNGGLFSALVTAQMAAVLLGDPDAQRAMYGPGVLAGQSGVQQIRSKGNYPPKP